jgi:hypothetical protein
MPRSGGASHPQKWMPAPVERRYPDSVAGIHDSFPVCRWTTPDGKRYSVRGRRANVEKRTQSGTGQNRRLEGRGDQLVYSVRVGCRASRMEELDLPTSSLVMQHRGCKPAPGVGSGMRAPPKPWRRLVLAWLRSILPDPSIRSGSCEPVVDSGGLVDHVDAIDADVGALHTVP